MDRPLRRDGHRAITRYCAAESVNSRPESAKSDVEILFALCCPGYLGSAVATWPFADASGTSAFTHESVRRFSELIVCENQKTGDPSSIWDISGSGDSSIQGLPRTSA